MNSLVLILFTALAAIAANAQSTNTPPQGSDAPLPGQTDLRVQDMNLLHKEVKPNEIEVGSVVYSGIAVQVAKTSNPLQLINPLAPAKYGSADENVVHSFNGTGTGLKVFAINF